MIICKNCLIHNNCKIYHFYLQLICKKNNIKNKINQINEKINKCSGFDINGKN